MPSELIIILHVSFHLMHFDSASKKFQSVKSEYNIFHDLIKIISNFAQSQSWLFDNNAIWKLKKIIL